MTFQRAAIVGAAVLVACSLASAAEPIITTYAGGGIGPSNGDGGPAT
jgi:hypothetical protein